MAPGGMAIIAAAGASRPYGRRGTCRGDGERLPGVSAAAAAGWRRIVQRAEQEAVLQDLERLDVRDAVRGRARRAGPQLAVERGAVHRHAAGAAGNRWIHGRLRGGTGIAPAPKRLHETLERTRMRHAGVLADAELVERLSASYRVLCIVNTRRHARELYEQLADAEGTCHLSTLMCAAHRRARLDTVRRRLRDGEPVRLIATSLVEAGVDLAPVADNHDNHTR